MPLPTLPKGSSRLNGEIILETRTARSVPNAQQFELSVQELNAMPGYRVDYPAPAFTHRTGPNPIYNCHGFTFASRRTSIFEAATVRQILDDDCYDRIDEREALPGDVVVYVAADGDVEHSGLVVRAKEGLSPPLVCSKWGKGGEVVHPVHRAPYPSTVHYEYYRVTK